MRTSLLLFTTLMLFGCNSSEPGQSAEDGVTVDLPEPEAVTANSQVSGNATDTLNILVPLVDDTDASDPIEPKQEPEPKPAPPSVKAAPKAETAPALPEARVAPPEKAEPPALSGDAKLLPARPPLSDGAIAGTLARMGHPCGAVTAANKVDTGDTGGIYKITCSSGDSYRGTNKGGHLFFRPWSDRRNTN